MSTSDAAHSEALDRILTLEDGRIVSVTDKTGDPDGQ